MLEFAISILQLIVLIVKNKFERDAELRKKRNDIHVEGFQAIKSRDVSALNATIDKLR